MPRFASLCCVTLLATAVPLAAQDGTSGAGAPAPQATQHQILIPTLQSLTITGEYRLRFEAPYNYDFRDERPDDVDFFGQRVRLAFDARVNDDLSVFIQLQDVRNWGEERSPTTGGIGTTDDSADGLDLHRGYLKIERSPLGGTTKIGRQVLSFGDERLVGALEWSNQGRAFDGVRHTWKEPDAHTIDVFVANIKERMPSPRYDDAWFGGVYATIDSLPNAELDLYALHLNDEETLAGGTENRTTLGARFVQTAGDVELGAEAATQVGEVNGADIDLGKTYAGHVHATYRVPATDLHPWVRLEANYATGDDPSTSRNERFANLFPTGHRHWGMMDFALWENTVHGMVELGVEPTSHSRLAVSWHGFRAVEVTDRFVGPVGTIAPTGNAAGSAREMGNEVDVFFHLDFDTQPAKSFLEAGYGFFLPGPGAKIAAGDDDVAHFLYVMSGLSF